MFKNKPKFIKIDGTKSPDQVNNRFEIGNYPIIMSPEYQF